MASRALTVRETAQDDWHNVDDPKERKRIQDRLAQRSRRRRLKDASREVAMANKAWCDTATLTDILNLQAPVVDNAMVQSTRGQLALVEAAARQAFSLEYEVPVPLTVFSALFINGKILGLSCFSAAATRSPQASPNVPLSLQPTIIQLSTVHLTGIDRFPFPKLRDNFIVMSSVIDEEEFSYDLMTTPSFTITPGRVPWDPKAWTIEKLFAEKWGFLFQ